MQGPVYFVSYGSAKFPDAVMVLHGSNVTIELHGNTFINGKTGVMSATFHALPDVPFESIRSQHLDALTDTSRPGPPLPLLGP